MLKEFTLSWVGEIEGANYWKVIPHAELDKESKQIIIK